MSCVVILPSAVTPACRCKFSIALVVSFVYLPSSALGEIPFAQKAPWINLTKLPE